MSRGLGSRQRGILRALAALPPEVHTPVISVAIMEGATEDELATEDIDASPLYVVRVLTIQGEQETRAKLHRQNVANRRALRSLRDLGLVEIIVWPQTFDLDPDNDSSYRRRNGLEFMHIRDWVRATPAGRELVATWEKIAA